MSVTSIRRPVSFRLFCTTLASNAERQAKILDLAGTTPQISYQAQSARDMIAVLEALLADDTVDPETTIIGFMPTGANFPTGLLEQIAFYAIRLPAADTFASTRYFSGTKRMRQIFKGKRLAAPRDLVRFDAECLFYRLSKINLREIAEISSALNLQSARQIHKAILYSATVAHLVDETTTPADTRGTPQVAWSTRAEHTSDWATRFFLDASTANRTRRLNAYARAGMTWISGAAAVYLGRMRMRDWIRTSSLALGAR